MFFKNKKDEMLVAQLDGNVSILDGKYKGNTVHIYFYLYENCDGKRRLEIKNDMSYDDNFNYYGISNYATIVKPWLEGWHFKSIPTYWECKYYNGQITVERYIEELYKKILNYK